MKTQESRTNILLINCTHVTVIINLLGILFQGISAKIIKPDQQVLIKWKLYIVAQIDKLIKGKKYCKAN